MVLKKETSLTLNILWNLRINSVKVLKSNRKQIKGKQSDKNTNISTIYCFSTFSFIFLVESCCRRVRQQRQNIPRSIRFWAVRHNCLIALFIAFKTSFFIFFPFTVALRFCYFLFHLCASVCDLYFFFVLFVPFAFVIIGPNKYCLVLFFCQI